MDWRCLPHESLEKQRVGPQVQARKIIFPSQIHVPHDFIAIAY
jgi:hypothetical protein